MVGLVAGPIWGTVLGLILGLTAALLFGLSFGDGYLRHIILRYLLAREGSIPPIHHLSLKGGYHLFLDHAADIGLLRKVWRLHLSSPHVDGISGGTV
jgi:hypothetical protein